jgi:hypothetical protein
MGTIEGIVGLALLAGAVGAAFVLYSRFSR